jgi:hypothetical protein
LIFVKVGCGKLVIHQQNREGEMTSETSKALLMIAMFASQQLALHYPRIRALYGTLVQWAAGFSWPADYELQPVPVRPAHRHIHLSSAF